MPDLSAFLLRASSDTRIGALGGPASRPLTLNPLEALTDAVRVAISRILKYVFLSAHRRVIQEEAGRGFNADIKKGRFE